MVEAKDVHKRFGHLHVLRGISMSVEKGQVCVVIGPSGSGKSTFLRCLNHLERIDAGHIAIDGEPVGTGQSMACCGRIARATSRACAPKSAWSSSASICFPHMTALGNVIEAPMRVRGLSRKEAVDRAHALLDGLV